MWLSCQGVHELGKRQELVAVSMSSLHHPKKSLTKYFLDESLERFLNVLDPSVVIDLAEIVSELGPATVEAVAKSTTMFSRQWIAPLTSSR